MNKSLIIILAVAIVIIAFIGIYVVSTNNAFVSMEETISQNSAQIDNQLKRRADLIPNLVNSVKGLTNQELALVESVTSSREKMTTGSTADRLAANEELSKSITILVENYPQVKSDKAFISLMDELAGTENRIAVARKTYNDQVAEYNKKVKVFPSSLIATVFGHEKVEYLEITEADKTNPEVKF